MIFNFKIHQIHYLAGVRLGLCREARSDLTFVAVKNGIGREVRRKGREGMKGRDWYIGKGKGRGGGLLSHLT